MDPSAEDGGGPPTALAQDAATPPRVAVPQQRSSSSGPSPAGASPVGPSPAGPSPANPPPGPASTSAPRRRTDGVAVAALVSGIVAAIPVTLVLGPLALIRVGRSGARGRALAITGLVLAGLWTVAAAIVAAAIITRPPPPAPATLPHVFSLRAGQCLDSGTNGITGVRVLSCAQAHDAEVFATFRVSGSRYPGAAALQRRARQGCVSRLSGYLNPQLSAATLAQSYVYPDAGAWSAGERTVVCTVRSTSGPLVGSVRAAS
ncbi:MAG: septum formation family protein [Streptosporangiaceae bacterium]